MTRFFTAPRTALALLLVLALGTAGCSRDLSRSAALQLIRAHPKVGEPMVETITLDSVVRLKQPDPQAALGEPLMRTCVGTLLNRNSLVAGPPKVRGVYKDGVRYPEYLYLVGVDLEDEAGKYVIGEPKVHPWRFGNFEVRSLDVLGGRLQVEEVTGLTESATDLSGRVVSSATFTWRWATTPFWSGCLRDQAGSVRGKQARSLYEGEALFVLYDDGWRLDSIDFDGRTLSTSEQWARLESDLGPEVGLEDGQSIPRMSIDGTEDLSPSQDEAMTNSSPAGSNPSSGPVRVGGDVKAPVVIERTPPEYTEIARKARIKGVVILEVIIDESGKVASTKVLKGLPMGLDQKAVEAVEQWVFEPARMNDEPVACIYNLTVNFQLEE